MRMLTLLALFALSSFAVAADDKKVDPLDALQAIVGKTKDSAEFKAFVKGKGEPTIKKYSDGGAYYSWNDHGFSFSIPKEDKVRAVFLYNDKVDGFKEYKGDLPLKLTFKDTRAEVLKKTGKPTLESALGGLEIEDHHDTKGLDINYQSKTRGDEKALIGWIRIYPKKEK